MPALSRLAIGAAILLAMLCGFLDPVWPEAGLSFKRLHIFLFNLVCGGALVIYHTEGRRAFSGRGKAYVALALIYALSAAAGFYPLTLAISVPLCLLVESVRVRRFSFLPVDFFWRDRPAGDKFLHASLLCLSLAVALASLVIANNEYLGLGHYRKLTLDVFFLGYSFPVSLLTFSLMFSFMKAEGPGRQPLLHQAAFWVVNAGVIVFFAFIVLEMVALEIAAALTLFAAVCAIYYLFLKGAPALQQTTFLLSGMTFLLLTGLTGVFYLLHYPYPGLEPYLGPLLALHAMLSLYGWNLSGLIIVIRRDDFPIRLSSAAALLVHWNLVLVLMPLGKLDPLLGLLAVAVCAVFLRLVLFSPGDPGPQRVAPAGSDG